MEQTLASLTMAMSGFHGKDVEGEDYNRPPAGGVDATVLSAGEAFAQNANIVFRGKQKPELGASEKAAKNWGRLKTAVKTTPPGELDDKPVDMHDESKGAW